MIENPPYSIPLNFLVGTGKHHVRVTFWADRRQTGNNGAIVATIGSRVRSRLHREEPVPDDSVCRDLSRGGDCRHAVATIELVPPRELLSLNLARYAERQSKPRRSKNRALTLAHEG